MSLNKIKTELIKGPFYSNCFLEALKAKIKNPKKIKITLVPKSEAKCLHFLWSDGENDYDFGAERKIKFYLWFKGYIRKRPLGFNQKYKNRMRQRWRNNHG